MSVRFKASHIAAHGTALGALLCALPVCAADAQQATIKLNTPGIIPEGVEYDTKNKRFLVGSLAKGTVYAVAKDGTLTPFIEDPDLKSSVGIEVDEERNRLLVPNSDRAVFGGQGAGRPSLASTI